jgi:hypothetical protein
MATGIQALSGSLQKTQLWRHIPHKNMARSYTPEGIKTAHQHRSTLSLIKEAGVLRVLGNENVSRPLGAIVQKLPDAVIDSRPISWAFSPIASQFGTVNSNWVLLLMTRSI